MQFRQLLRHFVVDDKIEKTHVVFQANEERTWNPYWYDLPKAEEIVRCDNKEDLKRMEKYYG